MDSDEEEMAAMRRNTGYGGGRGPRPESEDEEEEQQPLPKPPIDSRGDDSDASSSEPVIATKKPGFSGMALGPRKAVGPAKPSGVSLGPKKPIGPPRPGGAVVGPAKPSMGPAKPSMGPAKPSMGPPKPSMGPSKPSMVGPSKPAVNVEDDEEEESEDDEDVDDVRTAFPLSFGRAAPAKVDTVRIHADARRRAAEKDEIKNTERLNQQQAEAMRIAQLGEEKDEDAPLPTADAGDDDDDLDDDDDDDEEHDVLPFSHETTINAHPKSCQAMCIDTKGARMVTGSLDGSVHMFDFGGMTQEAKHFRELEPSIGHPVNAVSWNPSASMFVVAQGEVHMRLFDRDGGKTPILTTVRGDMYVRDMANTKGHTQEVVDVMWHPVHKQNWLSAGQDGTLRIWDVNAKLVNIQQHLPQMHVLKCVDRRNVCTGGSGTAPTCCAYHPDSGKKIVAGCTDGSIQLFNEKPRYVKADTIVRNAHNERITDVKMFGNYLYTRGFDDCLKQWDLRKFSTSCKAVRTWGELPNVCDRTGIAVSPDGSYVCAARSAMSKDGNGGVSVFNALDGERVRDIDLGKGHVMKLDWHKELNQLMASTTTGNVHVLYNPQKSTKGALLFMARHKSRKSTEKVEIASGPIFSISDGKDWKQIKKYGDGDLYKMRKKEKRENQKNPLPKRPGTGDGEYNPQAKSTSLAQQIIKKMGKNTMMQENARDELLKYNDRDDIGSFVNSAYSHTQPKNLLDHSSQEMEGDKLMATKKICPRCGMKMCGCGYMATQEALEASETKRQRIA